MRLVLVGRFRSSSGRSASAVGAGVPVPLSLFSLSGRHAQAVIGSRPVAGSSPVEPRGLSTAGPQDARAQGGSAPLHEAITNEAVALVKRSLS